MDAFSDARWEEVAKSGTPGRSGEECAKEWARALRPSSQRGPWAGQEDRQLLQLCRRHGLHAVRFSGSCAVEHSCVLRHSMVHAWGAPQSAVRRSLYIHCYSACMSCSNEGHGMHWLGHGDAVEGSPASAVETDARLMCSGKRWHGRWALGARRRPACRATRRATTRSCWPPSARCPAQITCYACAPAPLQQACLACPRRLHATREVQGVRSGLDRAALRQARVRGLMDLIDPQVDAGGCCAPEGARGSARHGRLERGIRRDGQPHRRAGAALPASMLLWRRMSGSQQPCATAGSCS